MSRQTIDDVLDRDTLDVLQAGAARRVGAVDAASLHMRQALADLQPGDPEARQKGLQPVVPSLRVVSARDLLTRDWPEPAWAVRGLLPVGLTLLAGRPKVGKSWLALQLMQSVATGGVFLGEQVQRAPCLYLALEDSPRRLAARMKAQGWERADVTADFVTIGEARDILPLNGKTGGSTALADAMRERGYRLVVIDTLSRALAGDQNAADVMTAALTPLQETAHEHNAAVLLVDHFNKLSGAYGSDGASVDPVLNVLGSTAKAAMADSLWGLYKQQGKAGALLAVTGRDLEERQLLLKHDGVTRCWQSEGDADQLRLTSSRQAILDALRQLGECQARAVAEAIGQDRGNTSRRLQDLVAAGLVRCRVVAGMPLYSLPDDGH